MINAAIGKESVLDTWKCLFDDDILDIIVTYTNQFVAKVKNKYARERDAQYTDLIEIKAFIGLLYLAGVYRSNRLNLEELWASDGDGIEKFRLTMALRRFKFLVRCMRFDDAGTREDRKTTDNLAPVRSIFEAFNDNCKAC